MYFFSFTIFYSYKNANDMSDKSFDFKGKKKGRNMDKIID